MTEQNGDRWGKFVGPRIARMRHIREMTQERLAELVGTHRPIVARMEAGRFDPYLPNLYAYARALDVDIRTLIDGRLWAFFEPLLRGHEPEPAPTAFRSFPYARVSARAPRRGRNAA